MCASGFSGTWAMLFCLVLFLFLSSRASVRGIVCPLITDLVYIDRLHSGSKPSKMKRWKSAEFLKFGKSFTLAPSGSSVFSPHQLDASAQNVPSLSHHPQQSCTQQWTPREMPSFITDKSRAIEFPRWTSGPRTFRSFSQILPRVWTSPPVLSTKARSSRWHQYPSLRGQFYASHIGIDLISGEESWNDEKYWNDPSSFIFTRQEELLKEVLGCRLPVTESITGRHRRKVQTGGRRRKRSFSSIKMNQGSVISMTKVPRIRGII